MASPLASRVSPITAIEVVDPQTIKLSLDEPFAAILSSLASIAIVPAEMETDKESLQQIPVGTGPFKFDSWKPNSHISLVKFDEYRGDGLPKLDGVNVNFVPESATRQVGIGGGDYHLLPGIDPATALQLEANPAVTVQQTQDVSYTLLGMNVTRAPLDNAKTRQAINMLLDRNDIISGALFGAGVPAGPLSPALATWALDTAEYGCYKRDVDGAKALLKEAGAEETKLSNSSATSSGCKRHCSGYSATTRRWWNRGELLNKEIGELCRIGKFRVRHVCFCQRW